MIKIKNFILDERPVSESSMCAYCRHFDSMNNWCEAMGRIPDDYLNGMKKHIKKVDGQKSDTVFEKIDFYPSDIIRQYTGVTL